MTTFPLNGVIHEVRHVVVELESALLQGKDLSSVLQHLLASLTGNEPTCVGLAVEDRAAQAVSSEQSLYLFRVIQEAVSSCIRHGHAQEVGVSLKMLKQSVRLSIRDNGHGFNPKVARGTGHGLANRAVRARNVGGRFNSLSKMNKGICIGFDLPKEASDVSH